MKKQYKFDLLFENIMKIMKQSEVSYTPINDIVLSMIANYLGMTLEEIKENNWHIEAYVADESDIISFVNDRIFKRCNKKRS
jgi:uncharacterized protein YrrD